jgi:hypothetical protein
MMVPEESSSLNGSIMDWEYAEFWDRFSSVLDALVVPI